MKPYGTLTLTGKGESSDGLSPVESEIMSPDDGEDGQAVPLWSPIEPIIDSLPPTQTASGRKTNTPKTTKPITSSSKTAPKATDSPWKHNITPTEMWSTRPNKRARDFLQLQPLRAKQAIQAEVQEPEYALRDVEIRDGMWHMMDLMERFSKQFFSGALPRNEEQWLRTCFRQLSPETAKIIGCVASGGPGGTRGWEELFTAELSRRALVMAIVGNVLVQQVFQHIFFGGDKKSVAELAQLQDKHRGADGTSCLSLSTPSKPIHFQSN